MAGAILHSWSRKFANIAKKAHIKILMCRSIHFIALLVWVCNSLWLFLSPTVYFSWYLLRFLLDKTTWLMPEFCLLSSATREGRDTATCFPWDSRYQQTTSLFRVYPLLYARSEHNIVLVLTLLDSTNYFSSCWKVTIYSYFACHAA